MARYLWLIPALATMFVAILFLLSASQRYSGGSWRERLAYLGLGLCLQAAALATAAQVYA